SSERATYQAGLNGIDTQLKAFSKQISNHEATLIRTSDPTEQTRLRGEMQALRAQLSALEPERERFEQKTTALEQPLADLGKRLSDAREQAQKLHQERNEGTRAHKETIGKLEGEMGECSQRATQTSRDLSLKFATLGTILNLNRVQG